MVFNKIDRVASRELIDTWSALFAKSVAVSAKTGEGFPALFDELGVSLKPVRDELVLAIPFDQQKLLARLHSVGQVLEEKYTEDAVQVRALVPPHLTHEFARFTPTPPARPHSP